MTTPGGRLGPGACLLAAWVALAGAEERIYVGRLDGVPLMNLQVRVEPAAEGRTTTTELEKRFRRRLRERADTVAGRLVETYQADAGDAVTRFSLEERQGESRTLVKGTLEDDRIVATVLRLGRTRRKELVVPPGHRIYGFFSELRRAVEVCREPGDTFRCARLQLADGKLSLGRKLYTLQAIRPDDRRVFALADAAAPERTHRVVAEPDGILVAYDIPLGSWRVQVRPAAEAIELGDGALLDLDRIVRADGAPGDGPRNRYRLAPAVLELVARDAFQGVADGVVEVRATARRGKLADPAPFLAASDELELDDPRLRAWVAGLVQTAGPGVADRGAALRRAVDARIADKDLGTADATALEAFRRRRGDCTEHAVLLCAALRIAGIPARIEYGLVWDPEHEAWIGHAWNSAWNAATARWLHLDAAVADRPRSAYLAFSVDLDPGTRTAQAMTLALGRLIGTTVESLPADGE